MSRARRARARAVLVPASLLMLLCFAAFFGPKFLTFAILSLAFVPWERLLASRGSARFTAAAADGLDEGQGGDTM